MAYECVYSEGCLHAYMLHCYITTLLHYYIATCTSYVTVGCTSLSRMGWVGFHHPLGPVGHVMYIRSEHQAHGRENVQTTGDSQWAFHGCKGSCLRQRKSRRLNMCVVLLSSIDGSVYQKHQRWLDMQAPTFPVPPFSDSRILVEPTYRLGASRCLLELDILSSVDSSA